MAGREEGRGEEAGRKRLYVELEPLAKLEVDLVQPDGSVTLLPPENPEEVFAKKVAFMRYREEEEKKKSEESAASDKKADQGGFLWKEAVDGIRASAHHTLQLSAFLDLLSKKCLILTLASSGQPHFFNPIATTEAKLSKFERAQAYLSTTMSRLQEELKVDSKFVSNLGHIGEKWNIKPLGRGASVSRLPGPVGALGISLSLSSSGSTFNEEFECVILRSSQGVIKRLTAIVCRMDPSYIPGNDTRPFKVGVDWILFSNLSLLRSLPRDIFRFPTKREQKEEDGQMEGPASEKPESVDNEQVNGEVASDKVVTNELDTESVDTVGASFTPQEFGGAGSTLLEITFSQAKIKAETQPRYAQCVQTSIALIQSEGGHVPRKPQVPPQLPSLGILPALDIIARHHRFRSSLLGALDTCASLPILGRILQAKLLCHRSERANVSRMCLELFNPLLSPSDNGVNGPFPVSVTPAIIAPGRLVERLFKANTCTCHKGHVRNMFTSTAPLKYFVENNMAVLFFQVPQTFSEPLELTLSLPFGRFYKRRLKLGIA
eukprot:760901-Hanusia_phi.AAC.1